MKIACLHCGQPYPDSGAPYKCPDCGGLFDEVEPSSSVEIQEKEPGIWRYGSSFGFQISPVSLGEGNTPLVPARISGREIFFKCEQLNPTGSFKDRGSATLVAFLKSRGVTQAIEDSSGNAGASFAAYAARAGIKARIYVPEAASGPKRQQIEMYGAELICIPGPRSKAAEAAWEAAERGAAYASHAYLPFNLAGYATCAYEIVEQLGSDPGAMIIPTGQGGFLLGLGRGFHALLRAGKIEKLPMLVGVQAAACAPLQALWKHGVMSSAEEKPTLAEGVRISSPLRAEAVVKMVRSSGGRFVSVEEPEILPGRDALARLGFYVEPTSALVWRALEQNLNDLPDPIVVILTGSGYKVR